MKTLSSTKLTDPSSTLALRRLVLQLNGGFLAFVGGVQIIFELLSHFDGVGPYGQHFLHSPNTIGFVEAHGLAFLIGLLFIRIAASEPQPRWHYFAVGVHLLLGGANILFWDSFVQLGLVAPGVIATVFHGVFVMIQSLCYKLSPKV